MSLIVSAQIHDKSYHISIILTLDLTYSVLILSFTERFLRFVLLSVSLTVMKATNVNKEILFQILVHVVVFVFYSFDRNNTSIEGYKYAYFINYAITSAIINYVFLPIFYKRKNLFAFILVVGVLILASALLEEYILERIYFTGKRAETIRMFWAFIEILPVVVILSGVKFGWDAIMKQNEVERLEDAIRESEMQFLKSQINPHFLFNNLNNLYSYALEGSPKTPEIILELSGLLRYMLYECKEEYVLLKNEISQLRNFVNLNNLQIEDRGKVTFNVNGIEGGQTIAPLILIVFVENAFKHSQSSQSDKIEIDIQMNLLENDKLHFTCSNSYQDIANNDQLANGIGLDNVIKRLDLMYPEAHKLSIVNENNTYIIDLTIDLNKSKMQ